MKLLRWLWPGMKIKRWFFLILFGSVCLAGGVSVLTEVPLLNAFAHLTLLVHEHTGKFLGNRFWGAIIAGLGFVLLLFGLRQLVRSITEVLSPQDHGRLVEAIYRKRLLPAGPALVAMGGGTGLSTLLRGLKQVTTNLTAVVTVSDDGGSSGRIRREMGILPPGDIRNCLVALADAEPLMTRLFQYRFDKSGNGLEGHTFGNLLIAAMTDVAGDFEAAVKESSKVLAIRGRVLPSTLDDVTLHAVLSDGREVVGETNIAGSGNRIARLFLEPESPPALPDALEAVRTADAVLVGPGSLYTSIIPNLLVGGMVEALKETPALVIYVCNVMTQAGETDGMTAADHLAAIIEHLGCNPFDYCLLNDRQPSRQVLEAYRKEGAVMVRPSPEEIRRMGTRPITADLLSRTNLARHDPNRLAACLLNLMSMRSGGVGHPGSCRSAASPQ